MGRPKLSDERRREDFLTVRMSIDELAEIMDVVPLKTSVWARDVLLAEARRLREQQEQASKKPRPKKPAR